VRTLTVGGVVTAALITVLTVGCSSPESSAPTQSSSVPAPASGAGAGENLEHCPAKVTIDVSEVITSPAPDAIADGWGFGGGDRVPCVGRKDCWFQVEVPDPSLYAADRKHWIPVSATKSELANPGGPCFDPAHN
jgi:hypothetical protein